MRIRQGWSRQVETEERATVAVELCDDDLARLLEAEGLSTLSVPVMTAYDLLRIEAERQLVALLVADHGLPIEQAQTELARLDRQKRTTLRTLPC